MLKIVADMHTHTLVSTHAYSTLFENLTCAKQAGLCAMAMTDHAMSTDDGAPACHFLNQDSLPKEYEEVVLFSGMEANIVDMRGRLDAPAELLQRLEWVIASVHSPALRCGSRDAHDEMWTGVAKNPHVDVIGHPGRGGFEFHMDKVIPLFKEYGKIVEINNATFGTGAHSVQNCTEIIRACKKYEVAVIVDSDAHFCTEVGRTPLALQALEEAGFPEHLILNADRDRFFEHMAKRTGRVFG